MEDRTFSILNQPSSLLRFSHRVTHDFHSGLCDGARFASLVGLRKTYLKPRGSAANCALPLVRKVRFRGKGRFNPWNRSLECGNPLAGSRNRSIFFGKGKNLTHIISIGPIVFCLRLGGASPSAAEVVTGQFTAPLPWLWACRSTGGSCSINPWLMGR